MDTKTLIMAGILFVVTLLFTCLLRIPLEILRDGQNAGAYLHLGDVAVYLSGALLGGPWGALVSALACAVADLIVGSAVYAIPTLIIKAAMAFLLAIMIKKDHSWRGLIRALGFSGGIMVLGYFLFDLLLLGDYEVAALGLPPSLAQAVVCGLIALPLLKLISGKLSSTEEASLAGSAPKKAERVK